MLYNDNVYIKTQYVQKRENGHCADYYIAICPAAGLTVKGDTEQEAIDNCKKRLGIYKETTKKVDLPKIKEVETKKIKKDDNPEVKLEEKIKEPEFVEITPKVEEVKEDKIEDIVNDKVEDKPKEEEKIDLAKMDIFANESVETKPKTKKKTTKTKKVSE